jgi:hypothetical protein
VDGIRNHFKFRFHKQSCQILVLAIILFFIFTFVIFLRFLIRKCTVIRDRGKWRPVYICSLSQEAIKTNQNMAVRNQLTDVGMRGEFVGVFVVTLKSVHV